MSAHYSEHGSVSLETAILAPAVLLILSLLAFGGRVALAHQSVQEAAVQAARAASIARTTTEAAGAATAAAQTYLTNSAAHCQSIGVDNTIDAVGTKVAGAPATVTSTVTCTIRVSDLYLPGLSGTRTIAATAVSVVDTYREGR